MTGEEEELKRFGASVSVGAKYDSHIVETLSSDDTQEDKDDMAGFISFSTYWQHKFNTRMRLRADYNIYADFYNEFTENDVIEQLASIEPQWFQGNFIFSLPLQYTYAIEDSHSKYHSYALSPTATVKFPNLNQAFEIYGMVSIIRDVDQYPQFDEDGHSRGGGIAYLMRLKDRSYFRLTGDYHHICYDSRARDYPSEIAADKRHDISTSIGADYNLQITPRIGLKLGYTFIHMHSNVDIYDYDKHIIQTAATLNF